MLPFELGKEDPGGSQDDLEDVENVEDDFPTGDYLAGEKKMEKH